MPKKYALTCLSELGKAYLFEKLQKENLSPPEAQSLQRLMSDIPVCDARLMLEVKPISGGQVIVETESGGKKRKKRAPSEYNIFISKCMKEAKIKETGKKVTSVMKECALDWRKLKGTK